MSRFPIGRRTVLRSLTAGVGVSIGLPLLDIMLGTHAQADALSARKLFGIVFWGNGIRAEKWVPAATSSQWSLSEELMPFAPVKDYLTVVSGMEVKDSRFGHHCATGGILSGTPVIDQHVLPGGDNERTTFGAPSLDVVVAREWAGKTRLKSLELTALKNSADEGTTIDQLSHNGPNDVNPAELSPSAVFDRLFRVQDPDDRVRSARASILDTVAADTVALKAKLGVADQARMDQHLESIRTLERQLQVAPKTCASPTRPDDLTPTGENLTARFQAMSDLLAVALACDITRVFSIRIIPPGGGYPGALGVPGISTGMHDLTHNEPGDQPQLHQCVVFLMKRFADLLTRFKDTTDATGVNLLDRMALLGTSDCQLGRDHNNAEFPILLAGKAGGKLRSNFHYRSSTAESSTKVLMTLLQSLDMPVTEFGAGALRVTEGIPELLI